MPHKQGTRRRFGGCFVAADEIQQRVEFHFKTAH